jgi:tetratricopeptide (TPR) repeat protein
MLRYDQGEIAKAQEIIDGAKRSVPAAAALYLDWAEFLMRRSDYTQAIENCDRAPKLEKNPARLYLIRARIMAQAQRYAEAIAAAQEAATKSGRESGEADAALGGIYQQMGRYEEAGKQYREAIRKAPKNIYSYTSYARLLHERGRDQEAKEVLRNAEAVNAGNASLLVNEGHLFENWNEPDAARPKYEQALKLDPANATVLEDLGDVRAALEDEEAVKLYRTAACLSGENASPRAREAVFWENKQRFDLALGRVREAVAVDPESAYAQRIWGNLELQRARRDHGETRIKWLREAIKHYRTAYGLDSDESGALEMWGITAAELGERRVAIDKLKAARDMFRRKMVTQPFVWPDLNLTLRWLAGAYLAEGQQDLADAALREAASVSR